MIRAFRDRAPNCFNFTKHKTIQQQKSLVFIQTLISYQFQFKPVKTLHLSKINLFNVLRSSYKTIG